jgi:hypothetical protein
VSLAAGREHWAMPATVAPSLGLIRWVFRATANGRDRWVAVARKEGFLALYQWMGAAPKEVRKERPAAVRVAPNSLAGSGKEAASRD